MSRFVQIAAVGARSPVGLTAESTAAAVRAGISRITAAPLDFDYDGEPLRAARDGLLEPTVTGWERMLALARSPLGEVVHKLGWWGSYRRTQASVPVLLGLPEVRPGWSEEDAGRLIRGLDGAGGELAEKLGTPLRFEVVAHGHAAALYALLAAAIRIVRREAELCIVGGVDSYMRPETIDWLLESKQLSSSTVRSGFFPGEGAGFVAVASAEALRRVSWQSLGELVGGHHAQERHVNRGEREGVGQALTEAVQGAVKDLRLPEQAVDASYGDINGERYRSEEWGFVALRLPHSFRDATAYEAPATSWGDVGAASGALFACLAVQSWQRGYARGPRALLWAGSNSGLRAAAVLQGTIPKAR